MGSIASVLQWHCQVCGQINPTESVKCLKCETKRISSHDGGSSRENCRDSSSEYTSRTGRSEGTTPGSEAIVIPTENSFYRCVLMPLLLFSYWFFATSNLGYISIVARAVTKFINEINARHPFISRRVSAIILKCSFHC